MPSSALQGLNVVEPVEQHSNYLEDLAHPSTGLDAQLDLWTNLAFQSDEPFIPRALTPPSDAYDKPIDLVNSSATTLPPDFDMGRLLASFAIDPFLVPPSATAAASASSVDPHDIASLLSSVSDHSTSSSSSNVISKGDPDAEALGQPPAKRARNRKASITDAGTSDEVHLPHSSMDSVLDSLDAASPDSFTGITPATPLCAAEDKRRRNTAASARFRAKKKEREAALEKKSKELESRVSELERECEALRRENGWLKGLVVGVTNAGNAASQGTKRRRTDAELPALQIKADAEL